MEWYARLSVGGLRDGMVCQAVGWWIEGQDSKPGCCLIGKRYLWVWQPV